MSRKSKRNNILAGLFLLGSLGLALVISFVLSDLSLTPSTPYVVQFDLREGATGLKPGSKVLVGGQEVGKVTRIEFQRDTEDRPVAVLVSVKIRSDLVLYDDTVAFLDLPLLGNLSAVTIPDAGGDLPNAKPLESGGIMRGTLAPPAFLTQAGFGPAERERVQRVLIGIDDAVVQMNDLLDRLDPVVSDSVVSARDGLADVRKLIADFSAKAPGWTDRIDRTLEDVNTVTADMRVIGADARELIADGRKGMNEAREVISSVQDAVDTNRPGVDRIVGNVESATQTFNDETLPRVNSAVAELEERSKAAGEFLERVRLLLDEQVPSIRRTFANLRLTSDQLKLVATEIRAQPWRLLIRPSTKELETQLVYDAARAYAESVSDLRAAGEALQLALERPDATSPAMLEEIARLRDELNAHVSRAREAERAFLQRLMQP